MNKRTKRNLEDIKRMNKNKKDLKEMSKVIGISRQGVYHYFNRFGLVYWNAGNFDNMVRSKKVPRGNICWKDGVRV